MIGLSLTQRRSTALNRVERRRIATGQRLFGRYGATTARAGAPYEGEQMGEHMGSRAEHASGFRKRALPGRSATDWEPARPDVFTRPGAVHAAAAGRLRRGESERSCDPSPWSLHLCADPGWLAPSR